MLRLALVALLAGGCTLLYGPPKQPADLGGGADAALDDLATTDDIAGLDLAGVVVWSAQDAATLQNLRAISGCSANNLFAPGTGGTVDRSTVAGTWTPTLLGANALLAASVSTCARIFVVGKSGTTYFSSDALTYKLKVAGSADLAGVWANAVGAAAVGVGGVAFYAPSSNNNWAAKTSGTTADLLAVWGSGTTFYAAGAGGALVRSTNSGQTWTAATTGVTTTLRAGWASASGDDVYIVGDGGVILHSTDAGATWPPAASGTSAALRGVWGSSPGDVYVVGAGGTILHSTDSGATWVAESGNTSSGLNGIWGSSPSDVYAVGDSGTILHRP
jgi:photosystem II stability/assembly factor-like uncharacterized protein